MHFYVKCKQISLPSPYPTPRGEGGTPLPLVASGHSSTCSLGQLALWLCLMGLCVCELNSSMFYYYNFKCERLLLKFGVPKKCVP